MSEPDYRQPDLSQPDPRPVVPSVTTDSGVTMDNHSVGQNDLLGWLQAKLASAETSLRCREDMQRTWAGGTTESWRAAGCRLTREQRLKTAAVHGHIAVKCRREVEMLTAALNARKTAEQSLDEITRVRQTEIVALRQAEQRAEDAEKACAHKTAALIVLRDEQNGPPLFKRIEQWNAAMNLVEDALRYDAGRDYVPKSKLDDAIKALELCQTLLEEVQFHRSNDCYREMFKDAIAAAEKVTGTSPAHPPADEQIRQDREQWD